MLSSGICWGLVGHPLPVLPERVKVQKCHQRIACLLKSLASLAPGCRRPRSPSGFDDVEGSSPFSPRPPPPRQPPYQGWPAPSSGSRRHGRWLWWGWRQLEMAQQSPSCPCSDKRWKCQELIVICFSNGQTCRAPHCCAVSTGQPFFSLCDYTPGFSKSFEKFLWLHNTCPQ